MLLADIAEAVADILNSSPGKWTTEPGVVAKVTLDWAGCLRKTNLQVLVVPEMVQYDLENSSGRRKFIGVNSVKFISVMVGKGFDSLPTSDSVAPWEECKELVSVRERVTQLLIANKATIPDANLIDLEETPVDEMAIDHRNFVAMTQLGYEVIQCGSGPDLLSS